MGLLTIYEKLGELLGPETVLTAIPALRSNPYIWSGVQEPLFLDTLCEKLGADRDKWNPGSICMLKAGLVAPEAELWLRLDEFRHLIGVVPRTTAISAYDGLISGVDKPETLSEMAAAVIGFMLAYCKGAECQGIRQAISEHEQDHTAIYWLLSIAFWLCRDQAKFINHVSEAVGIDGAREILHRSMLGSAMGTDNFVQTFLEAATLFDLESRVDVLKKLHLSFRRREAAIIAGLWLDEAQEQIGIERNPAWLFELSRLLGDLAQLAGREHQALTFYASAQEQARSYATHLDTSIAEARDEVLPAELDDETAKFTTKAGRLREMLHAVENLAPESELYRLRLLAAISVSTEVDQKLQQSSAALADPDWQTDVAFQKFVQAPHELENLRTLRDALTARSRSDEACAFSSRLLRHPHASAADQHAHARLLRGLERHADSLRHFVLASQLDPRNANYLYHLGMAQARLAMDTDALDSYERAAELDPQNVEIWLSLIGKLYQTNDDDLAHERTKSAVLAAPTSARLLTELASQYLRKGNLMDAGAALIRLTNLAPESQSQAASTIEMLESTGRKAEAYGYAAKAYQIWPQDDATRINYIRQLEWAGEYQQAFGILNTFDPADLSFQQMEQSIMHAMHAAIMAWHSPAGELDPFLVAIHARYEQAYEADKENIALLMGLAELALINGKTEHAGQLMRYLLPKLNGTGGELAWRLQRGLSLVALRQGQAEAAVVAARTAAGIAGADRTADMVLSYALESASLTEEACHAARSAVENQGSLEATIWLADRLTRCGNAQQAGTILSYMRQKQPKEPALILKSAAVLGHLGEQDEALGLLEQLTRDFGDNADMLTAAGKGYIGLRAWPQALACYEKAQILRDDQAADGVFAKAVLTHLSGDSDSALAQLEELIAQYPASVTARAFLVELLNKQGLYEQALDLHMRPRVEGAEPISTETAQSLLGPEWTSRSSDPETANRQMAFYAYQAGRYNDADRLLSGDDVLDARYLALQALVRHSIELDEPFSTLDDSLPLEAYRAEVESGKGWALQNLLMWYLIDNYDSLNLEQHRQKANLIGPLLGDPLINLCLDERLEAMDHIAFVAEGASSLLKASDSPADDIDALLQRTWQAQKIILALRWLVSQYAFDEAMTVMSAWFVQDFRNPLTSRYVIETLANVRSGRWIAGRCKAGNVTPELLPSEKSLAAEAIQAFTQSAESELATAYKPFLTSDGREVMPPGKESTQLRNLSILSRFDSLSYPELVDAYRNRTIDSTALLVCLIFCLKARMPEALTFSQKALERRPNDAFVLFLSGLAQGFNGDQSLRLSYLERALQIRPQEAEWRLQALAAVRDAGDGELRTHLLEEHLKQDVSDRSLVRELLAIYTHLGEHDHSVALLERLLHADDQDVEAWFQLVEAHATRGDLRTAMKTNDHAISALPNSEELLVNKARLLILMNEYRKAESEIEILLRMFKHNVHLRLMKAQVLSRTNRKAEAAALLSNLPADETATAALALQRIQISGETVGADYARQQLTQLVTDPRMPQDDHLYMTVAEVNLAAGRLEDAEVAAQKALQLRPGLWRAYQLLGSVNEQKGLTDVAIGVYQMALQQNPGNMACLNELSRLYRLRGQHKQAQSVVQEMIKLHPERAESYVLAAQMMREVQDLQGAEAMLRKASEMAPDDVRIKRQLGAIIALNLVHNS